MGLSTDTEGTEFGGGGIDALLLKDFCQTDGIRRNSVETGGAEVLDELNLALGVACRSRNRHST